MIRLYVLLAIIPFSVLCHATAPQDETAAAGSTAQNVGTSVSAQVAPSRDQAGTNTDQVNIVKQHDLATHLGLKPSEVLFKAPRNFRAKGLNDMGLDDIQGDGAKGVDEISPLSDNRK